MRKSRAVGLTALAGYGGTGDSACSGTPGQQRQQHAAPAARHRKQRGGQFGRGRQWRQRHHSAGCRQGRKGRRLRLRHPARTYEEPAKQGRRGQGGLERSATVVQQQHHALQLGRQRQHPVLHQHGFTYYDQDLNLINNDQFGTCEIVSLDPLTSKYTVNEGVKWSDGVQIGAADMILSWAAQSGFFNDEEAKVDDEGNLLPYAGVAFDKADPSLSLIKDFPTIGDDGRSATFVWSQYYLDYQTASPANNGAAGTCIPAHVVGEEGTEDRRSRPRRTRRVINAFKNKDKTALKPIADFWNTGFDADQLPADPGLYLSSGPYKVTAVRAAEEPDVRAEPGLQVGSDPVGRQDQLLDHR